MVSVIVTTYNRANLISRITVSLQNQSYKDLQIIIVNDGSTDNTAEILAGFAQKDTRIDVINKDNGGLCSARNSGIERALGEYLFFVDDDDELPIDYIDSFMQYEYDNDDLVIDSYSTKINDEHSVPMSFDTAYFEDSKKTINYLTGNMPDKPYCFFAHGKRFKTSIIKDANLDFDENIRFVEDRPFVLKYILTSKTCRIINNHKYIVKSDYDAGQRLSRGLKDISWLWSNIMASYNFLLDVSNKIDSIKVVRYADNYLATRLIDYLYMPYADGAYHTGRDKSVIKETTNFLVDNVRAENIQRTDAKVFFNLMKLNFNLAASFLRARIIASNIKHALK